MLALDVVRLEAGLILIEVDYTSARHAMNPEQNYSPGEIGLGRLVSFDKGDFVGRLALEREAAAGGPARRLVGLQLDWYDIEGLYDAQGLPPAISPTVDRDAGAGLRGRAAGRPRDEPRLEPDPQAGDRARLGRPAVRGARHERSASNGPSRAGAGASPRPSSSCRSSTWSASAPERYAPRTRRALYRRDTEPVTPPQGAVQTDVGPLTRPGGQHRSDHDREHDPA